MDCIALQMLYSTGDWQYFNVAYQRLCMNWTTVYATGFTFAYMYFKDISAPLESICYLGPLAWYIKEKKIKQARQKRKKEKKTIKTNTNTVCKGSRFVDWVMYEGHFRSNITVLVTSLSMIQFSKTNLILHDCILLTKWLSLKQKMHFELEVTRLYTQ